MEGISGRSGTYVQMMKTSDRDFTIGPDEVFEDRMVEIIGGTEPPSSESPVRVDVLMRRLSEIHASATVENMGHMMLDFHGSRPVDQLLMNSLADGVVLLNAEGLSIRATGGNGLTRIFNSLLTDIGILFDTNNHVLVFSCVCGNVMIGGAKLDMMNCFISGNVAALNPFPSELTFINCRILHNGSDSALLVPSGWTVNIFGGVVQNDGDGLDIEVQPSGICQVYGAKYSKTSGVLGGSQQIPGFFGTIATDFDIVPYSGREFVLDPGGVPLNVNLQGAFEHGSAVRVICASTAPGSALIVDPGGANVAVSSPDGIKWGDAQVLFDRNSGRWFQIG